MGQGFIRDGDVRPNRLDDLDIQCIFIDFHGEASSEKQAMGNFSDGRASFVVGTHTHVPSADHRVLPKGTGYMTDAGMCGAYDSIIGMDKTLAVARFVRRMPGDKLFPADGPVTLCGVIFDVDGKTGLCTRVEPFRSGTGLSQAAPAA